MTGSLRWGRPLAFAAATLAGCSFAPDSWTPARVAPNPDELACAAEAEQLLEPVAVQAAPERGAAELADLEAGRFIYRCERRGDWLAIRFPGTHEPVDCGHRPAGEPCPVGWVRGEVRTAIFG